MLSDSCTVICIYIELYYQSSSAMLSRGRLSRTTRHIVRSMSGACTRMLLAAGANGARTRFLAGCARLCSAMRARRSSGTSWQQQQRLAHSGTFEGPVLASPRPDPRRNRQHLPRPPTERIETWGRVGEGRGRSPLEAWSGQLSRHAGAGWSEPLTWAVRRPLQTSLMQLLRPSKRSPVAQLFCLRSPSEAALQPTAPHAPPTTG